MKIDYTLTTKLESNGVIQQQLESAGKVLRRWMMDTQDAATRNALIALGWTPPTHECNENH